MGDLTAVVLDELNVVLAHVGHVDHVGDKAEHRDVLTEQAEVLLRVFKRKSVLVLSVSFLLRVLLLVIFVASALALRL